MPRARQTGDLVDIFGERKHRWVACAGKQSSFPIFHWNFTWNIHGTTVLIGIIKSALITDTLIVLIICGIEVSYG